MTCPNCSRALNIKRIDNQSVLHCENCGGSFFEQNGINRITLESAHQLIADKQTDEISAEKKHCPKDGHELSAILNDEAIPQGVTLLRCKRCRGIFVFPDDLVQFKKAQGAKIDYYKTWQTPFSTLRTVVVLSFILFIGATAYLTYNRLQQSATTQLQAADQIKNVSISSSGRFLFMSFQTESEVSSEILFKDQTTGEETTKNVSIKPVRTHVFSTTELNLSDDITYRIVLHTQDGDVIQSPERKLIIPQ